MSILSRLFGGGAKTPPEAEPEVHGEFRIFAEPVKEPGGFRVSARIEKRIDGELKSHRMIRADICGSEDTAREVALHKARTLIDQQGDALFG